MTVTLSYAERWSLINQYRILEILDAANAHDYKLQREALESGFSEEYGESNIYQDELSVDACRHVIDVLNMYRILHFSYQRLSAPDKAAIDPTDIQFEGFDGNEEPRQLSYCKYLLEQGKWQELQRTKADYNSHSSTADRYEKMLQALRTIQGPSNTARARDLTKDEILRIVG